MAETFTLSPYAKDLTGERFGSLVAIRPLRKKGRNVVWDFMCDCGSSYVSEGCWVVANHKKATSPLAPSCGCVNRETTRTMRYKHGYSKHPLFWVWVAMVQRCHAPNSTSYHKYGAKGVYVCNAWRNDAESFITWALDNGWERGLHLDKDILSHKLGTPPHYSPDTCQFINPSDNCRATKNWLEKNYG